MTRRRTSSDGCQRPAEAGCCRCLASPAWNPFARRKAPCTSGCSGQCVPSLSKVVMRASGGMQPAPSFHDGSGSTANAWKGTAIKRGRAASSRPPSFRAPRTMAASWRARPSPDSQDGEAGINASQCRRAGTRRVSVGPGRYARRPEHPLRSPPPDTRSARRAVPPREAMLPTKHPFRCAAPKSGRCGTRASRPRLAVRLSERARRAPSRRIPVLAVLEPHHRPQADRGNLRQAGGAAAQRLGSRGLNLTVRRIHRLAQRLAGGTHTRPRVPSARARSQPSSLVGSRRSRGSAPAPAEVLKGPAPCAPSRRPGPVPACSCWRRRCRTSAP